MAKIRVERSHSLQPEQLRELGDKLAGKLTDKLGGQCEWQGDELSYKQSGASARVVFDPATVVVTVELGLMMSAFSGTVQGEVERVLDEYLG